MYSVSENWRSLTMHSYLAGSSPPVAGAPGREAGVALHTSLARLLPCQVHLAALLVESIHHLLAGAYSSGKEEPASHQDCRGYLRILRLL